MGVLSEGVDYGEITATIANGASLSDAVQVEPRGKVVGVELPTITSAAITFQASTDGVTYRDLYNADGTTETAYGASTGDRILDGLSPLDGVPYLKVRSGTTGAAVNQGAARAIKILVQSV